MTKKDPAASYLLEFAKKTKREGKRSTKLKFPTYTLAIDEIIRLQERVNGLLMANAMLSKKPRGRPKSIPNLGSGLFGMLMKSFGMPKPKKTPGRPKKYQNISQNIEDWDNGRKSLALKEGKKSVTDLYLINHILDNDKEVSYQHKIRLRKEIRAIIKHFRDSTGVRTKTRSKREIPK